MRYGPTLSSAAEFSREGKLEEWVLRYLGSEDGHNQPFAQGLRQEPRVYLGPYLLPVGWLERCSGPEPDIEFPAHPMDFENRVRAMEEFLSSGRELPPVIVNVTGGRLVVNDGNHRVVAYERLGHETCWAILWATMGEESRTMEEWAGTHIKSGGFGMISTKPEKEQESGEKG